MNGLDQIKLTTQRHLTYLGVYPGKASAQCADALRFLNQVDNPFTRKNLSGHITASAWIVDPSFEKTLLINHGTLNLWMQPGGHIDAGEYPAEAAAREAKEETGLESLMIHPPGLFDVDIHAIPNNPGKEEPEHLHYDLRYLMVAESQQININRAEVKEARWVSLRDIVNNPENYLESIVRMANNTLERQTT